MNLLEYVGKRIQKLRDEYAGGEGISQETLAKALNVATNTVSRWETATYRPSLEDLERLARFFGVSILEFFPPEEGFKNDQLSALLRAAKHLKDEDIDELRRYAEFRKMRSIYGQKGRPKAGRKARK